MALSKFKPASFDLTNNYAFTGTTTGVTDTNQLVLIKTLTASSSGTLNFVNGASGVVLDATYKTYLFKFINLHPSANDTTFRMAGRDGGTAYDATMTSTFFQAYNQENDGGASLSYLTGSDLAQSAGPQHIMRNINNTSNDMSGSGEMFLFNPSSTTFVKHFQGQTNYDHVGGSTGNGFFSGYFNVTAAIDGVQFTPSSGNIDSGTIKLYGIL